MRCFKNYKFWFSHVGALLGKTLNDKQFQTIKELENIEKIFLIHPEPENLVIRLSQIKYVHCYSETKINGLSKEELLNNINRPSL